VVHVDQGDPPDGAAREGLDRPGTHAADADDADIGLAQARETFVAVEPGNSTESPLKIHAVPDPVEGSRYSNAPDRAIAPPAWPGKPCETP
jgi:hypothetical protein